MESRRCPRRGQSRDQGCADQSHADDGPDELGQRHQLGLEFSYVLELRVLELEPVQLADHVSKLEPDQHQHQHHDDDYSTVTLELEHADQHSCAASC